MNTKIKALGAVAIMIAVAFAAIVPAMSADDSSAEGEILFTVTPGYYLDYTVLAKSKDYVLSLEQDSSEGAPSSSFAVKNAENDDISSDFRSGGVIKGTVPANASDGDEYTLTITCTNKDITPNVSSTQVIKMTVNKSYDNVIRVTDETTTVSELFDYNVSFPDDYADENKAKWTFSAAGLPAGLAISKTGNIYGVPNAVGTYPIKITGVYVSDIEQGSMVVGVSKDMQITVVASGLESITTSVAGNNPSDGSILTGTENATYQASSAPGNDVLTYTLTTESSRDLKIKEIKVGDGMPMQTEVSAVGLKIIKDENNNNTNKFEIRDFTGLSGMYTMSVLVSQTVGVEVSDEYLILTLYVMPNTQFLSEPTTGVMVTYV